MILRLCVQPMVHYVHVIMLISCTSKYSFDVNSKWRYMYLEISIFYTLKWHNSLKNDVEIVSSTKCSLWEFNLIAVYSFTKQKRDYKWEKSLKFRFNVSIKIISWFLVFSSGADHDDLSTCIMSRYRNTIFSSNNRRIPYTEEDDMAIITYITENKYGKSTMGKVIWDDMRRAEVGHINSTFIYQIILLLFQFYPLTYSLF